MAIHLPRQRDSFGVPARYVDLKSSGLLYVPPSEWRYDGYDIDGDVATLYAQDVDLADYQYNADGFDAHVLPAGATAITGGNGMWKVEGGKLYFKMPLGGVWGDTGWGTGFTSVAVHMDMLYGDLSDNTSGEFCYCLAVQGGVLYYCTADPDANFNRNAFGNSADWLTVVASVKWTSYEGASSGTILGTNTAGQMVKASMTATPEQPSYSFYAHGAVLGGYTNWQLNGPISTQYGSNLAVYSLGVEKTIGYLFELKSSPAALSYLGDGWTAVSGYAKRVSITSESPYTYTRIYGIRNGNLYSLARSATGQATWTATLIDDSGDWYMVQFIEPDVAVAIRRVNTAGGGSGTIDPLGDVIVSGTSTNLDGTYTLVSGTGESRLWRRDDGYNRYEIYFDSGYWVIHSSYDEMGNGENYMMHFDECRGAGTDPWTATWETSWDDGVSGNQGTVPTVTGTEA